MNQTEKDQNLKLLRKIKDLFLVLLLLVTAFLSPSISFAADDFDVFANITNFINLNEKMSNFDQATSKSNSTSIIAPVTQRLLLPADLQASQSLSVVKNYLAVLDLNNGVIKLFPLNRPQLFKDKKWKTFFYNLISHATPDYIKEWAAESQKLLTAPCNDGISKIGIGSWNSPQALYGNKAYLLLEKRIFRKSEKSNPRINPVPVAGLRG